MSSFHHAAFRHIAASFLTARQRSCPVAPVNCLGRHIFNKSNVKLRGHHHHLRTSWRKNLDAPSTIGRQDVKEMSTTSRISSGAFRTYSTNPPPPPPVPNASSRSDKPDQASESPHPSTPFENKTDDANNRSITKTNRSAHSLIPSSPNYPPFINRLLSRLPQASSPATSSTASHGSSTNHHDTVHRPTKDQLLAAATSFWQRLKIRWKWFSIRSWRRFNTDDWTAFGSWLIVGNTIWIIIGTTTFVSVLLATFNFSLSKPMWQGSCQIT